MKKLLFLVGIASLGLTFGLEKPETPDIDRESQDLKNDIDSTKRAYAAARVKVPGSAHGQRIYAQIKQKQDLLSKTTDKSQKKKIENEIQMLKKELNKKPNQ